MKASKILEQVIYLNNVEQQGIAVCGLFETIFEFVERWFGESVIISGDSDNNCEYFYSYNEPLLGIADIIVKNDDSIIYLYKVED